MCVGTAQTRTRLQRRRRAAHPRGGGAAGIQGYGLEFAGPEVRGPGAARVPDPTSPGRSLLSFLAAGASSTPPPLHTAVLDVSVFPRESCRDTGCGSSGSVSPEGALFPQPPGQPARGTVSRFPGLPPAQRWSPTSRPGVNAPFPTRAPLDGGGAHHGGGRAPPDGGDAHHGGGRAPRQLRLSHCHRDTPASRWHGRCS